MSETASHSGSQINDFKRRITKIRRDIWDQESKNNITRPKHKKDNKGVKSMALINQ